jgi:hypothetical protein
MCSRSSLVVLVRAPLVALDQLERTPPAAKSANSPRWGVSGGRAYVYSGF